MDAKHGEAAVTTTERERASMMPTTLRVALSALGVALADNQFPHYLIDQPEIGHIKPNGDLILHGAIFGMQFFF